jgi:hypothetical protein
MKAILNYYCSRNAPIYSSYLKFINTRSRATFPVNGIQQRHLDRVMAQMGVSLPPSSWAIQRSSIQAPPKVDLLQYLFCFEHRESSYPGIRHSSSKTSLLLLLKLMKSCSSPYNPAELVLPLIFGISNAKLAAPYIAVSYCWGDASTMIKTTSENLSSLTAGIAWDLPETFQDAIILVKTLEIRYLWIDALCIL